MHRVFLQCFRASVLLDHKKASCLVLNKQEEDAFMEQPSVL